MKFYGNWPLREWSNGGLRTPMPEKRSAMKSWDAALEQFKPRAGWAEAARRIRERDEDRLIDSSTTNSLTPRLKT
jgi:hypothetical protein